MCLLSFFLFCYLSCSTHNKSLQERSANKMCITDSTWSNDSFSQQSTHSILSDMSTSPFKQNTRNGPPEELIFNITILADSPLQYPPVYITTPIMISGSSPGVKGDLSPMDLSYPLVHVRSGAALTLQHINANVNTDYSNPFVLISSGGNVSILNVAFHVSNLVPAISFDTDGSSMPSSFVFANTNCIGRQFGTSGSFLAIYLGNSQSASVEQTNFTNCSNTAPNSNGGALSVTIVGASAKLSLSVVSFTLCYTTKAGSSIFIAIETEETVSLSSSGFTFTDCFNGDVSIPQCDMYVVGISLEAHFISNPSFAPISYSDPSECVGYDPLQMDPFPVSAIRAGYYARSSNLSRMLDEENGRNLYYCGGYHLTSTATLPQRSVVPCRSLKTMFETRNLRRSPAVKSESVIVSLINNAIVSDIIDLTDGWHSISSDSFFDTTIHTLTFLSTGQFIARATSVWMWTKFAFARLLINFSVQNLTVPLSLQQCDFDIVSCRLMGTSVQESFPFGLISLIGGSLAMIDTMFTNMASSATEFIKLDSLYYVSALKRLLLHNTSFSGLNLAGRLICLHDKMECSLTETSVSNTTVSDCLITLLPTNSFDIRSFSLQGVSILTPNACLFHITTQDCSTVLMDSISFSNITVNDSTANTDHFDTSPLVKTNFQNLQYGCTITIQNLNISDDIIKRGLSILSMRLNSIDDTSYIALNLPHKNPLPNLCFVLVGEEKTTVNALMYSESTIHVMDTGIDNIHCGSHQYPCATIAEGLEHFDGTTRQLMIHSNSICCEMELTIPLTVTGGGSPVVSLTQSSQSSVLPLTAHFEISTQLTLSHFIVDYTACAKTTLFGLTNGNLAFSSISFLTTVESTTCLAKMSSSSISLVHVNFGSEFKDLHDIFTIQDEAHLSFEHTVITNREISQAFIVLSSQTQSSLNVHSCFLSNISIVQARSAVFELSHCLCRISKSRLERTTSPYASLDRNSGSICLTNHINYLFYVFNSSVTIIRSSFRHLAQTPFYILDSSLLLNYTVFYLNNPVGALYPSTHGNIACSGDSVVSINNPISSVDDTSFWVSPFNGCKVVKQVSSTNDDVVELTDSAISAPFTEPVVTSYEQDGSTLVLHGERLLPCSMKVILFNDTRSLNHGVYSTILQYECTSVLSVSESQLNCTVPNTVLNALNQQWRVQVQLSMTESSSFTSNSIIVFSQHNTPSILNITIISLVASGIFLFAVGSVIALVILVTIKTRRSRWRTKQEYLIQQRMNNLLDSSLASISHRSMFSSIRRRVIQDQKKAAHAARTTKPSPKPTKEQIQPHSLPRPNIPRTSPTNIENKERNKQAPNPRLNRTMSQVPPSPQHRVPPSPNLRLPPSPNLRLPPSPNPQVTRRSYSSYTRNKTHTSIHPKRNLRSNPPARSGPDSKRKNQSSDGSPT
ncbi:hypothetical protein BLNAU_13333 [Blattamonas nauphoetae]|uniref:Transmembrane protein n=1 Tax=Blattamonas nauphoetae TaxID=2049346 RepID=A0ABQ9XI66_9EUKA|nr:hypothetical protein BLNAU_13333 [Blattamonas nauphoetae]